MLIGIDDYVRMGRREDKDGIYYVSYNLLLQFLENAPRDYRFVLLQGWKGGNGKPELDERIAALPRVTIPGVAYHLWLRAALSIYLAGTRRRPSVLWCPYGTVPSWSPCPTVAILHDLAFLKYPKYFRKGDLKFQAYHTDRLIRKATRIVVPSENTKSDIIALYQSAAHKIRVIHWGVEKFFRPQSEAKIRELRARYSLMEPYVLFVGTRQPRKNLFRLIEAFIAMKRRTSLPHRLVFAGRWGWLCDRLMRQVADPDVQKHVILLDYIPRGDLPALYSGADLFILPSLYEGFGLPLVEAMACGTPVAAANNSSLPEIVGEAGLLFDAENVDEIRDSIIRVLTETLLQKDLRDKGLERAKNFSWDRSSEQLLGLFKEVA